MWVWSLGWENPLEEDMTTPTSILVYRIPWMEESGGLQYMGSQRAEHDWSNSAWRLTFSRVNTKKKKDVLFIIGDWNVKVRSQEIPWITGKFGLGGQNEAGKRLTEFCQENILVIANTLFQQHKRQCYTSVQFGLSVMSDALRPHGLSTPGFPVHHQLPAHAQTHVHWATMGMMKDRNVKDLTSRWG